MDAKAPRTCRASAEKDILDLSKYDYYSAGSPGGWFGLGATPAGWYKNDPGKATPVFGQDTGACGVANPGNQVSEMSVQYNKRSTSTWCSTATSSTTS